MSKETNSVKEEIREEKKKFKSMTFQEKKSYIWYYYRLKIFWALFAIAFLVFMISEINHALRPYAIRVMFLNSQKFVDYDQYESDFAHYASIDTGDYQCSFEYGNKFQPNGYDTTSVAILDTVKAGFTTGMLDAIVASESDITYLAGYGYMSTDITEYLEADVLESVKDHLYYFEYTDDYSNSVSDNNAFNSVSNNSITEGEEIHTAILGIIIDDFPSFQKIGLWENENEIHILTISPTSQNLENLNKFLRFMIIEQN